MVAAATGAANSTSGREARDASRSARSSNDGDEKDQENGRQQAKRAYFGGLFWDRHTRPTGSEQSRPSAGTKLKIASARSFLLPMIRQPLSPTISLRIPPCGTLKRAEYLPCPRSLARILVGPPPQRDTRR